MSTNKPKKKNWDCVTFSLPVDLSIRLRKELKKHERYSALQSRIGEFGVTKALDALERGGPSVIIEGCAR